ncbi:MAG: NfeD family protein [Calditrichaceae bacterium]|jgi:membrane-bound ClpP family serine protease
MSLNQINHKIIIRYSLFQVPTLIIVIFTVFTIDHWYELDNTVKIIIILSWIMKDIIIFPFVWKSYIRKDHDKSLDILKHVGIAVDNINPKGYVRINGEIWKAESVEPHESIIKGQSVEVVEINGLRLKVRLIIDSD